MAARVLDGPYSRAMSQENVEATKRTYEAVSRRDFDAFLALMDPEIVATPLIAAMEEPFRGHEGIGRWWETLVDTFSDFTVDFLQARSLGEDLTLAQFRAHGHGAGSDAPFDRVIWQLVEWRDGRCVRWDSFESEDEALDAAGRAG